MTAAEVAALVASCVSAVLVVALAVTLSSLLTTLRELRAATEELRRTGGPLVADMRRTVDHATAELDRVGDVIAAAENITGTVDSASKLAYAALSNPVVKVMAFGTGTARAARRLRHRDGR